VDELVATDSWGQVQVLDVSRSLLDKRVVTPITHARVELGLVGFARMQADGARLLVLRSSQVEWLRRADVGQSREITTLHTWHHTGIVLLDSTLRIVLRHEVAAEWNDGSGADWPRVADLDSDGVSELMVLTGAMTVYRLR
jgi:hypothetical protein